MERIEKNDNDNTCPTCHVPFWNRDIMRNSAITGFVSALQGISRIPEFQIPGFSVPSLSSEESLVPGTEAIPATEDPFGEAEESQETPGMSVDAESDADPAAEAE